MSEYPKMVYLHDGSLAYRVVENREEYEFYKAKGFVLERWDVKPKKEPLPMPRTDPIKPEPKKDKPKKSFPKWRCDFCGKHLKRYDHSKCGGKNHAGKVEETAKNDGNSGTSSGKTMEKEQGSGENGQECTA